MRRVDLAWWFALPVSFVAAMLAATVAFLVARYVLGDQFHEKLPKRFRGLNEVEEVPFQSSVDDSLDDIFTSVVHWILAASPIRLPVFLIGTAIGILPGVVAIIVLGQSFVTWWDEYALWLIAGAITLAIAYVAHQKRVSPKISLVPQPRFCSSLALDRTRICALHNSLGRYSFDLDLFVWLMGFYCVLLVAIECCPVVTRQKRLKKTAL